MSPYRIELHDANGAVIAEQTELFEHDDAAIDHAGRINHRDALKVWQGERLVAHFPPLQSPPLRHP
jgi:hypothetical protein